MKRTSQSRRVWNAALAFSLALALAAPTSRSWAGSASSPPGEIDGMGNVFRYAACAGAVARASILNSVGDMVIAFLYCGQLMAEEK
jgi:hypothetical protein